MKVCVFGAGAIGGYMAAKLGASGQAEVSVVARGPHLAAIKASGLTLKAEGETLVTHPRATDDAKELGPQDYVVIAVKAHSLPAAAPGIRHLIGERTALARAQMVEAQGVAEKLGVKLPLDVDARIAGAAEVGAHKPSTLIDLERGRPMEIDALLGAVVEIAKMTSVPVPQCESVLALVRQLGRSTGTYAEPATAKA